MGSFVPQTSMSMKTGKSSLILKAIYLVLITGTGLVLLEFGARAAGLGDPIIYYNSVWGGLRPLPDQQVERIKQARVTIDKNGFRTAKTAGRDALRILYLGDSVTWGGSSVDDQALFSEVASDVLRQRGMEVYSMNAGVNGTSLMNQAGIYAQLKDSIDALVWLFPWGDVSRTYVTGGFLWPPLKKPRFALVEAVDQVIRMFWLPAFREDEDLQGAAYLSPEIPRGYLSFYEDVFEERAQKNLGALHEVTSDAIRKGLPIMVGITPEYDEGQLLPMPGEAKSAINGLSATGVRVMDLHQLLGSESDLSALFIDHIHFSAEGHAVIGHRLGSLLLEILRDRESEDLSGIVEAGSGN